MWSGDSDIDRIIKETGGDAFEATHVNRPVQLVQCEVPFFPYVEPIARCLLWIHFLQPSSSALNGYKPLLCFLLHRAFTCSEFFLRLNIHEGIIVERETILLYGILLLMLRLLNDVVDAFCDILKGLITVIPRRDGFSHRRQRS